MGADRSVFRHIKLPAHCQPVYLDWIAPLKNETLAGYALRLAEKINPSETFSLVGLSMGGMISVEITRHLNPLHTILISSIPSAQQLPRLYRYLGALKVHKFVPVSLLQKGAILKRLFSAAAPEDKKILKTMIRHTDMQFVRWAMEAILNWQGTPPSKKIVHIHGTNDEILPWKLTKPTHVIEKGSHLMVMNRAPEINRILAEVLV